MLVNKNARLYWLETILTGVGIAVIGARFAAWVIGARVVDPFNTAWLSGDAAQTYLGWEFLRHETHLSFSLGWSAAIGYPLGEPIAWLDAIPIVASVFWLARNVLPLHFQYLGLYFCLNSILQLYFGYRICRHLSGNNRLAALVGGLLFMMAPAFVWRAFGHFAISSQWPILAALELFWSPASRLRKSRVIWSVILCFLAGGINPYLTSMVLLILGASHLRELLAPGETVNIPLKFQFLRTTFMLSISVAAAASALTILASCVAGGLQCFAADRFCKIRPATVTVIPA